MRTSPPADELKNLPLLVSRALYEEASSGADATVGSLYAAVLATRTRAEMAREKAAEARSTRKAKKEIEEGELRYEAGGRLLEESGGTDAESLEGALQAFVEAEGHFLEAARPPPPRDARPRPPRPGGGP